MPRFKFTGFTHPDELANGRPLAIGDEVELSKSDLDANRRLIDSGLLIELSGPSKTKTKNKEETDK